MKPVWKLAIVAGVLALCACTHQDGPGEDKGGQVDCSAVRCPACPEGQKPALAPPDCCKCIPA